MLINLSNHPSTKWGKKQLSIANENYGDIFDIQFPSIPPETTSAEVSRMAECYYEKITQSFGISAIAPKPNAVHIQGEFTFVFKLVTLLKNIEISCIASTSERKVEEYDS
jgi:hypothetical protein